MKILKRGLDVFILSSIEETGERILERVKGLYGTEEEVTEGQRLAREGMEKAYVAEDKEWRDDAWELICEWSKTDYPPGEGFNADDIKDIIGDPWRPNSIGGLFYKAKKRGIVEINGHRPMKRKNAHGRTTFVYKGTPQRLALRTWGRITATGGGDTVDGV